MFLDFSFRLRRFFFLPFQVLVFSFMNFKGKGLRPSLVNTLCLVNHNLCWRIIAEWVHIV